MDRLFFFSALYLGILMLLSLFRAVAGPTVMDRLIGANAIGTKTTAMLIVVGSLYHRVEMFVDIALAYALLNFLAVLAAARYFQKKKDLFPEDVPVKPTES